MHQKLAKKISNTFHWN